MPHPCIITRFTSLYVVLYLNVVVRYEILMQKLSSRREKVYREQQPDLSLINRWLQMVLEYYNHVGEPTLAITWTRETTSKIGFGKQSPDPKQPIHHLHYSLDAIHWYLRPSLTATVVHQNQHLQGFNCTIGDKVMQLSASILRRALSVNEEFQDIYSSLLSSNLLAFWHVHYCTCICIYVHYCTYICIYVAAHKINHETHSFLHLHHMLKWANMLWNSFQHLHQIKIR